MWPGEPVAKVLEDLQSAWRWGRVPNLLTAMELVMWTLMVQRPDKVGVHVIIHSNLKFISLLCKCNTYSNKLVLLKPSWFRLAG